MINREKFHFGGIKVNMKLITLPIETGVNYCVIDEN